MDKSIDELIEELNLLEEEAEKIKKKIATVKQSMVNLSRKDIDEKLAKKDAPFGSVTVGRINFNIPKKVEWDQDELAKVYKEIGETADEYIDVTYKVSETKYKSYPKVIQKQFEPARTVSDGNIAVKVKEEK